MSKDEAEKLVDAWSRELRDEDYDDHPSQHLFHGVTASAGGPYMRDEVAAVRDGGRVRLPRSVAPSSCERRVGCTTSHSDPQSMGKSPVMNLSSAK